MKKVTRRKFIETAGLSLATVYPRTAGATNPLQVTDPTSFEFAPPSRKTYSVIGGGIAVELSEMGEIISIIATKKNQRCSLRGWTALEECESVGPVTSKMMVNGGVEFTKSLDFQRGRRQATLVERFLPSPTSVRWEIEILGKGNVVKLQDHEEERP